MSLNLKPIDSRIHKLQKLRELLSNEDTRELLADPEMLALIHESASSNGNGTGPRQEEQPPVSRTASLPAVHRRIPADGTLKRRVYDIALANGGRFNRSYIVGRMRNEGFHFEASEPDVAVNQALRRLVDDNLIRVYRQGMGRRASIYEVIQ
jgi:hypothetical protein